MKGGKKQLHYHQQKVAANDPARLTDTSASRKSKH
jgi:hypothetical protein